MASREQLRYHDRPRIQQQVEELLWRGLTPAGVAHKRVLAEGTVVQDVHAEHPHGLGASRAPPRQRVALDDSGDVAELAQPPERRQALFVHAARAHQLQ
jgi:hypothetical protein